MFRKPKNGKIFPDPAAGEEYNYRQGDDPRSRGKRVLRTGVTGRSAVETVLVAPAFPRVLVVGNPR